MKRRLVCGWCLALVASVGCASTYDSGSVATNATVSSRGSEVGVSYFYDSLSPYGQWIEVQPYGWCWTPYDVSSDWRPYSDGHWEYTEDGWCWAANEPWGWAPYHYGRWTLDDSYGWVWVPDHVWGPAWVAWCSNGDWVGWAPLPPGATWAASTGLAFSDARTIPSTEWCFVPRRHLLDAGLQVEVASVARNVTLLEKSRGMTRFEVRGGRPANLGVDVALIQTSLGRPVPRTRIVDVDSPDRGRGQPAGGGAIGFYRPTVRPMPEAPAPELRKRNDISDEVLQQRRDEQQRRLESDLAVERARLAREQEDESRNHAAGAPGAGELERRHAAELRAFEAHAEQQRRVLEHRMEQQIVRPDRTKNAQRQDKKGSEHGKGGA